MLISGDDFRKFSIFHPVMMEKYVAMQEPGARFVHYCSAEAAYWIIKSNRMRLRNAAVMNDFSEIEYGLSCLKAAWDGPPGDRIKTVINGLFPDVLEELMTLFNGWAPHFRQDTYITCLSEHDADEDNLGRLSMWRAYGGAAGVAIVLNPGVFLGVSTALAAFSSPVAYFTHERFAAELDRVTANMLADREFLIAAGRQDLLNRLFQVLRFAVLCTKHPGFAEEREWRVIYAPGFAKSDSIKPTVELIRGVPQLVYSIPFVDYPELDFVGAELPKLINRVIVGPTQFPEQLREAAVYLLMDANVPDAANKVVVSQIPLRQ